MSLTELIMTDDRLVSLRKRLSFDDMATLDKVVREQAQHPAHESGAVAFAVMENGEVHTTRYDLGVGEAQKIADKLNAIHAGSKFVVAPLYASPPQPPSDAEIEGQIAELECRLDLRGDTLYPVYRPEKIARDAIALARRLAAQGGG